MPSHTSNLELAAIVVLAAYGTILVLPSGALLDAPLTQMGGIVRSKKIKPAMPLSASEMDAEAAALDSSIKNASAAAAAARAKAAAAGNSSSFGDALTQLQSAAHASAASLPSKTLSSSILALLMSMVMSLLYFVA